MKDVFDLPKFKAQERDYHYMVIRLKNGVRKGMLFYKGACVANEYSSLAYVPSIDEIEEIKNG